MTKKIFIFSILIIGMVILVFGFAFGNVFDISQLVQKIIAQETIAQETIVSEKLTHPTILSASVKPTKVQPWDVMLVGAEIKDEYGIESVTADMGGIEKIELRIKNQESRNSGKAPKQGIWEAEWLVHNTEIKNYITTITATNVKGLSSFVEKRWSDPTWTSPTAVHSKCGETSSMVATNAKDDDTNSYWTHNSTCLHWIIFDLGVSYTVSKIQLYQSSISSYRWGKDIGMDVYVSDDPADFGSAVWTGVLNATGWQESGAFSKNGRYVKFVSSSDYSLQRMYEFDAYCAVANYSPTAPVFSKLFDNEKTADTTPDFEFKSTDGESDDLEYQIEIDDDYNFGSINVSKTSETDAGFVNTENGSNTHPFTQNQTIRFTVQAGDALTNGTTYWWRVKAKDPSGCNIWGSYSSKRSFTVDTSVTLPTWFQTTEEQFDTDTLTDTMEIIAADKVQLGRATPVYAAVTTSSSSGYQSSSTFSHTVPAGDNRLLIVTTGIRGDENVSSVTYAGTNLALAKSEDSGSSSGTETEIWYLVAPSTGANNVVVTYSSSVGYDGIAALSYTGVNQSSPIGATAGAQATSGTDTTVNITTTISNSLIVGGLCNCGGDTDPHTPGTGTTERYDFASGISLTGDGSFAGGEESTTTAGTHTFNFTSNASDDWTIAAVEVKGVDDSAASGNIISSTIDHDDGTGDTRWDEVCWNDDEINGDIKYQVQYYTGSAWALVSDGSLSGNSTGFDTSPIDIRALNITTYNQIRLKGNFTNSSGTPYLEDWTVKWRTNSASNVPTISSPSDGATGQSLTPDLVFNYSDSDSDNCTKFDLQVDNDLGFGSPEINETNYSTGQPWASGGTITYSVVSGLSASTKYYWKVRVYDGTAWSDWSDGSWDFTTSENSAPVASAASIDSDAASITLTEGTTKSVVCTATVTDADGFGDIDSVEAKLYRTSQTASGANDNNHRYTRTGNGECVPSGGSGNTETYTCAFAVQYYADPTDGTSVYSTDNWTCQVTPTDGGGAGTADTDTIEMASLTALSATASINYSTINLGASTSSNQTVVVTNTGNECIDLDFDGYGASNGDGKAMTCDIGSITIANEKYGFTDVAYASLTYQLSDTTTERDADIVQRTNGASTKNVYFGFQMPADGAGGSCTGKVNLAAHSDPNQD